MPSPKMEVMFDNLAQFHVAGISNGISSSMHFTSPVASIFS